VENPTRRRVLAAGVTGAALGLLGSRTASASPDTTPSTEPGTAPTTEATTTTTLPPLLPTADDIALLNFAEAIELTARDLYQDAIDAGIDDDVVTALNSNHRGYSDAVRGRLGTQSVGVRDEDLYNQYEAQFKVGDVTELAAAAYELESTLVATHIELLSRLRGTDGARVIAAILIVEARHAAVLADIAGKGDDFDALFEDTASPLSPVTSGS
jgi:Ferritin-like domain